MDKIKRLFDIVGALLGLLILSPIFLLISIIQMCFVGIPIFFNTNTIRAYGFTNQREDGNSALNHLDNSNPLCSEKQFLLYKP